MGVAGRPGGGSDAEHRGAGPPLWCLGAQTQPGDKEGEGASLGGAGLVMASHLSHPGASDVAAAGRSGVMSIQRREA